MSNTEIIEYLKNLGQQISILNTKIDKIDTIERDEIKIGSHTVYISETYKQSFFERLK